MVSVSLGWSCSIIRNAILFLVPCQNPFGALCPHRLVRMDFVFLCALWHLVLIWYSVLHCLTQVVLLCLLLSLSFTWTVKS